MNLQRTDGFLRKVVTKTIGGEKMPQKYINKPIAVPSWREFVTYLLAVDKSSYVSVTFITTSQTWNILVNFFLERIKICL